MTRGRGTDVFQMRGGDVFSHLAATWRRLKYGDVFYESCLLVVGFDKVVASAGADPEDDSDSLRRGTCLRKLRLKPPALTALILVES